MAILTQPARLSLLQLEMPGNAPVSAGVLLEDPAHNRLYLRLRRDWDVIAPAEAIVLSELESDLAAKTQDLGAARVLDYLQDTLSNTLTISPPREVMVEDFERAVQRLYREHVHTTVRPFVTHLPRYSLAVAAGKFLENHEVSEDGWEEIPSGITPTPAMFVARIVGHSMEPRIPHGSLCVFRAGVTGSREGRLVLVEYDGGGTNDRHTVKRYRSVKRQRPDGSWSHETIRLEPLNSEFEAWELNPEEDRFRIVAEFVQVLY
ncbi:MAG: S24 family peptidase [Acidobacteriia bacterium]|nr:S24 family peptidase [Terriglobia bacterium]